MLFLQYKFKKIIILRIKKIMIKKILLKIFFTVNLQTKK